MESEILECEVKWALENITTNKHIIAALILKPALLCPQHASETISSGHCLSLDSSNSYFSEYKLQKYRFTFEGKGNTNSGKRPLHL